MDRGFVSELARRLIDELPANARILQQDLQANFETLLQSAFSRLDLVTREEFEVQQRVLARTREKLERLEAELAALSRDSSSSRSETPPAPEAD